MAINDVAGEWVYNVWDILREFLGHNFVPGLRTIALKPKNPFKTCKKKQKKIFTSFSPGILDTYTSQKYNIKMKVKTVKQRN